MNFGKKYFWVINTPHPSISKVLFPTFPVCLRSVAQVDSTLMNATMLILWFVALYLCFSYKLGAFCLFVG